MTSLSIEVFHYSLGKRTEQVAAPSPTSYNPVYLYWDAEATAFSSVYLVGIVEYQIWYEA